MKKILIALSVALVLSVTCSIYFLMKSKSVENRIPVTVKWRQAVFNSNTMVALIGRTDNSRDIIRVKVSWTDDSVGGKKETFVDLTQSGTQLGHLEGFKFIKGDKITVSKDGYTSVEFLCP